MLAVPIPIFQSTLDVVPGGHTTPGFSSGTDALTSDVERPPALAIDPVKKKKKKVKKDLLHHREKAHPDKIKRMC